MRKRDKKMPDSALSRYLSRSASRPNPPILFTNSESGTLGRSESERETYTRGTGGLGAGTVKPARVTSMYLRPTTYLCPKINNINKNNNLDGTLKRDRVGQRRKSVPILIDRSGDFVRAPKKPSKINSLGSSGGVRGAGGLARARVR